LQRSAQGGFSRAPQPGASLRPAESRGRTSAERSDLPA
jgi:hypothetical protein